MDKQEQLGSDIPKMIPLADPLWNSEIRSFGILPKFSCGWFWLFFFQ